MIVSLGSSVAAKKVEITFWHAMGAQLGDTLESLVSEFNAQSPDVFVRAEYQGNYGALSQKLVGALVARKPPTMALVYGNWAAEHRRQRARAGGEVRLRSQWPVHPGD